MKSFSCPKCGFVITAIIPPDTCPSCNEIFDFFGEYDEARIHMRYFKNMAIENYWSCNTCLTIFPKGGEHAFCPNCCISDYHYNRESTIVGVKSYLKSAKDYAKDKIPKVVTLREKLMEAYLVFDHINKDKPESSQSDGLKDKSITEIALNSGVADSMSRLLFICPFCGFKQEGYISPDCCSSCKNWLLPPSLRGKTYPSMNLIAKKKIKNYLHCEKCKVYQKFVGIYDPACPYCSQRQHHNNREHLIFNVKSFLEDSLEYLKKDNPSVETAIKKLHGTYDWFIKLDWIGLEDEEYYDDAEYYNVEYFDDDEYFDIETAVNKYLLSLPRCTAKVVIASPQYGDKRYSCEIIINTDALVPWAEHHAQAVYSSDQDEQVARLALPVWLKKANIADTSSTYIFPHLIEVLRPYALDFITMGITEVVCPSCRQVVEDIEMKKDYIHFMRPWTEEWYCPKGHLLYRQDHKARRFF